jgi:hypothetical protein
MSAIQMGFAQDEPESQISMLLQHHYGDGLAYLSRHKPKALFSKAKQDGFIDAEGYLTRKGRALMARYKFL